MPTTATNPAIASRVGRVLPPVRRSDILTRTWPLWPALLVLLLFFVLPLTLILPESARHGTSWTLTEYRRVIADSYYWTVIGRSFRLAAVTTLVCLLLGYPTAYYCVRLVGVRWKRVAYMLLIAPLFTSAVIRAMAWTVILGKQGILNQAMLATGLVGEPVRLLYNETAIVVGLVYIMVPFMVLTIASVLENLDRSLEEAAADLGAGPIGVFARVTLPLSVPGVMAGSFLVLTLSLSAYVTPALLGGGRSKVISMLIFEQFLRVFDWPLGATISCLLLAVTFVLMWTYNRLLRLRVVSHHMRIDARL